MKTTQAMLALALALNLAFVTGCGTTAPNPVPDVVVVLIPSAVELASCKLARKVPESAPYLRMVGSVFTTFGGTTPPTPAELKEAVENVTSGAISTASANLIWAAVNTAYAKVYADGIMTKEKKAAMQGLLTQIGDSLALGANCVQTSAKSVSIAKSKVSVEDVKDVTDTIAASLCSFHIK